MKLPGRNTVTLCPSALMGIVQKALNDRTYDSDKQLVRVLGVESIKEGHTAVFHFEVTTDPDPAAAAKAVSGA